CATNSLEYCVLALGAIRAGGIVAPMNARFTRPELAEIVAGNTPRLIFADAECKTRVDDLGPPVLDLAQVAMLRRGPAVEIDLDLDPNWPVVIISTSGSTARPKGVVYTHTSAIDYACEFLLQEPSISKGARVLALAPLSTSAGFVQLMHYMVLGCSLYME